MNREALESGSLIEAPNAGELALLAGIPIDALERTLREYNAAVDAGRDPLGRSAEALRHRIAKPPFYIAPFAMSRHHTIGGARIDARARVLDREGEPIPGLFAAGEVAGGIHGVNRLGGNGIAEIFTFGRIAGEGAAKG